MSITIKQLHYYPVKALAGHSPQKWTLEDRGFKFDRRWMFVNPAGNFMSQRKYPEFVHWQASVEGEDLVISDRRDTKKSFRIKDATKTDRPLVSVTLWQSDFETCLVDDPIVEELVAEMGIGAARLVFLAQHNERPIDPRYANANELVSLADGYPYLITNTTSLADANERMGEEMLMTRFRANIVVETEMPWAEDNWSALSINGAQFRLPKPCARCRVVTINQESGEQRIELLGELSRFRRKEQKILFGMNAIWEGGTTEIKVGDRVEVLQ